jgi:hypothetical protein
MLLSLTWYLLGLAIIFAIAFRHMSGTRVGLNSILSPLAAAVSLAVRAAFSACGQIGTAVAPNNPFIAFMVQLALFAAILGALYLVAKDTLPEQKQYAYCPNRVSPCALPHDQSFGDGYVAPYQLTPVR